VLKKTDKRISQKWRTIDEILVKILTFRGWSPKKKFSLFFGTIMGGKRLSGKSTTWWRRCYHRGSTRFEVWVLQVGFGDELSGRCRRGSNPQRVGFDEPSSQY
jgi:hypothetical protein